MPNLIQYLTTVTSAVAQKSLLIQMDTHADPSTLHRLYHMPFGRLRTLQREREHSAMFTELRGSHRSLSAFFPALNSERTSAVHVFWNFCYCSQVLKCRYESCQGNFIFFEIILSLVLYNSFLRD